jgi:hypothetical protein
MEQKSVLYNNFDKWMPSTKRMPPSEVFFTAVSFVVDVPSSSVSLGY